MKKEVLATTDTLPLALAQERPAPAELFSRHVRFVWRVLGRYGLFGADVEDAAQEVFLTAYRRLDDWDPERASAQTWLYAIAVKVAANHHRRSRRPPPELLGARQATDPSLKLDRRRAIDRLRAVLEAMEPERREVFALFEIEGLPMKEVARMVGCPLQTAYTRLHAARREAAEALGEGHKP